MPLDAVHRHRLAHQHGVEPAAAALAARDDTEFVPAGAQKLADLVRLLGRERPLADARRVGLGDAQHIADRTGTDACPR